jgi:4-amino-4-deoxy-L-arabinose transferase-like glycosyltransferase
VDARFRTALIAGLLAVGSVWLYTWRLGYAPPHPEIDEVLIGLDAHAIATTGRDLRGERLPLYSQTAGHSWYQPMVIYITALALKVMPFSERAVRLPTACIGALNVALMFLLVRRMFDSTPLGVAAAVFLALTPAHFLHSRYAMDYMYPVTFVLGWLLCLQAYVKRPRTRAIAGAAAVLGLGFYSYISSIVLMPVYVGLTVLLLAALGAPRRHYAVVAAVFGACLIPFLVWFAGHPGVFGATVEKYGGQEARGFAGVRSLFHLLSVSDRVSMYWNMISPSVLFLTGGSRVMFSTGRAGVFLLPCAVLLPVGLYRAATRPAPLTPLLVLGFLVAPLPALMVTGDNAPIFRALTIVPFGVLLAVVGLRAMWRSRAGSTAAVRLGLSPSITPARVLAAVLLILMPIQFGLFWTDYFGPYRARVNDWLGGSVDAALETLIAEDARHPAPGVYFSVLRSTSGIVDGRNPYMDVYWRFYLTKHDREELLARTHPFDPGAVAALAPGSLVLANIGDQTADRLVASGALKPVAVVPELDRAPFFEILQR